MPDLCFAEDNICVRGRTFIYVGSADDKENILGLAYSDSGHAGNLL